MQHEPNMTIRETNEISLPTYLEPLTTEPIVDTCVCICLQNQMWSSRTYISIILLMENKSIIKKK